MKPAPKIGTVKGNLTIVDVEQNRSGWLCTCRCSCGRYIKVGASKIIGYKSRFASCNIDGHRLVNVRHGFSRRGKLRSTEHTTWVEMRQRCENPKDNAYADYGGRGIQVCIRWQVFENFLADMGRRPSPLHTLDRRDNDGPYSPDNCRWATRKEQANNRRSSRKLKWNTETKTIAEWAAVLGLSPTSISQRLASGWSVNAALSTPPMKNQYATK